MDNAVSAAFASECESGAAPREPAQFGDRVPLGVSASVVTDMAAKIAENILPKTSHRLDYPALVKAIRASYLETRAGATTRRSSMRWAKRNLFVGDLVAGASLSMNPLPAPSKLPRQSDFAAVAADLAKSMADLGHVIEAAIAVKRHLAKEAAKERE